MSDERGDGAASSRAQLHEKLDQTGELDLIEIRQAIDLAPADEDADLKPETLFTDSVMMTFSRSGKTGALPIALARGDDEDDDEDLRPYDPSGPRLAIAHLSNGLVVRGLVEDVAVGAGDYALEDSGGGRTRHLTSAQIRTLHLMLPADMAHPEAHGPEARVTLRNGASIEGQLPDFDPDAESFFLLPRGEKFMERILVFRHAVADLQVD